MTAPPPAALSVRALTKRYGTCEALREVSFEVGPGEIFGLIGPNGAGKTSMLECILGLRRPDAGQIGVFGIDVLTQPAAALEEIGAQLQISELPAAMTPREALRLCGRFYRRSIPAEELIARFALTETADRRFSALSGGEQKRVALALAFVNDPRLVLLDEPSAGLDPTARHALHALIASQRSAGRTIVLTTHYLEEAGSLCDRVALLDHGRVAALGSPAELMARSRTPWRVLVRTDPDLAPAEWAALAGVVRAERRSEAGSATWVLETSALTDTVRAVAAAIEARGVRLCDLRTAGPTLEDVYAEFTRPRP